jgi:D-alanine-D-alanine ligase
MGLLKESRVVNHDQLVEQATRMVNAYGGTLIEEFIEGREFIVLVSENPDDAKNPVVYEPLEAVFTGDDTFKYEKLKWEECSRFHYDSITDSDLASKLKEISQKMFVALNGSGYGRCDLRMKSNGDIYVLEINPNSGIMFPDNDPGDDDYILQRDPRGYKYFLDLLFRSAINRRDNTRKNWYVGNSKDSGLRVYALHELGANDSIVTFDGAKRKVATLKALKETIGKQELDALLSNAYRLPGDLFVLASPDPSVWLPFGHSERPNTRFDGTNVVAKRRIKVGEEILIDNSFSYNEAQQNVDLESELHENRRKAFSKAIKDSSQVLNLH